MQTLTILTFAKGLFTAQLNDFKDKVLHVIGQFTEKLGLAVQTMLCPTIVKK